MVEDWSSGTTPLRAVVLAVRVTAPELVIELVLVLVVVVVPVMVTPLVTGTKLATDDGSETPDEDVETGEPNDRARACRPCGQHSQHFRSFGFLRSTASKRSGAGISVASYLK